VRRLFLWPYLRSAYADEEIFLWAWSSMPSGDATSAPKGCGLAPLGLPVWRCAGMSAVEIVRWDLVDLFPRITLDTPVNV
jgi:hypothetical protein